MTTTLMIIMAPFAALGIGIVAWGVTAISRIAYEEFRDIRRIRRLQAGE